MLPVGFHRTTPVDMDSTPTSAPDSKSHSLLRREVVASDGTTIETRNEGVISGADGEFAISGTTTYRLFFLVGTELRAWLAPDQPPVTNGTTWDCQWKVWTVSIRAAMHRRFRSIASPRERLAAARSNPCR